MQINQLLAASPAPTDPTTTGAPQRRELDQGAFLQLLVAQLKNQDPVEPQDPSAFVAQLAQFNQLDQLIGIRQSLKDLAGKLS